MLARGRSTFFGHKKFSSGDFARIDILFAPIRSCAWDTFSDRKNRAQGAEHYAQTHRHKSKPATSNLRRTVEAIVAAVAADRRPRLV